MDTECSAFARADRGTRFAHLLRPEPRQPILPKSLAQDIYRIITTALPNVYGGNSRPGLTQSWPRTRSGPVAREPVG